MQRCGYVALVGKPNAGKSTLFNALMGQKLAVVSRKPQTTRNRILGVVTDSLTQFLFLDSPGVHHDHHAYLNKAMNSVTDQVIAEASVVIYMADINRGIDEDDLRCINRILKESSASIIFLYSQSDRLSKMDRKVTEEKKIQEFRNLMKTPEWARKASRFIEQEPRVFSSKNRLMVQSLLEAIKPKIPESVFLYPVEDITDRPGNFIASEIIREQIFRCLGKEVPYETAVYVTEMKDRDDLLLCRGEIIVARESHKPMVIGKKGVKVKEIGTLAKESLQLFFQKKVYLDLSVRVQQNWINERDHVESLAHLLELSVN